MLAYLSLPVLHIILFILGILTGLIVIYIVAGRLRSIIVSIPVAYAWNPNSHDKMTSYAIRLLQDEANPTLIGWVFKESLVHDFNTKRGRYFLENYYDQLRKGSIEEDMNSDAYKSILTRVFRPGLERSGEATKSASYEGTNGVYHFYNPHDETGLYSDTQFLIALTKALWSGRTIPSAVARATDSKPDHDKWFLDNEKRTYTEDDAIKYFRDGHYHLSFYTIGRILHLLQDMAVPSHVRNSSHADMFDEPPDPLEYYADYMDSEFERAGSHKEYAASRWEFNARVDYARTKYSKYRSDIVYRYCENRYLGNKKTIANRLQHEKGSITRFLMNYLASYTKNHYYSFGTIPCNADSLDPERKFEPSRGQLRAGDRQPLINHAGPDLKKCRVNVDGFFDVIDFITLEVKEVVKYLPNKFNSRNYNPVRTVLQRNPTLIIGQLDLLNEVIEEINVAGFKAREMRTLKPIIDDLKERWACLDYKDRNTGLRDRLVHERDLNGGELTFDRLQKTIEEWVKVKAEAKDHLKLMELFKHPPNSYYEEFKREIREYFKSSPKNSFVDISRLTKEIGFHGPYCLVNNSDRVKVEDGLDKDYNTKNHVIHDQYLNCESLASVFCAVLISKWFEDQYRIKKRGLGLWVNKDAPDRNNAPRLGYRDEDINENTIMNGEQHKTSGKYSDIFTLGIINHLPSIIDLDISLTLSELKEADKEEFPNGLNVKTIMRTDFYNSKEKNPIHREHQSQFTLYHKKEKDTDDNKITIKELDLEPYNIEATLANKIPKGDSRMGGVLREHEGDVLFKAHDSVSVQSTTLTEEALEPPKIYEPVCVTLRFEFGNDKFSQSE